MAHWFEDLTKTVADEKLPRRQALRRIAGSVTGMALASLLPAQALARADHLKKHCSNPCNCSCGFVNCNGNTNCFCFLGLDGKGVCGCNSYCSQVSPCTNSSQCKKGFGCITANGCTGCSSSTGVCIPYCAGKHKNCQLGGSHSGKTVAS
jgi:hypothetical protein